MNQQFQGWQTVAAALRAHAVEQRSMAASGASAFLDAGQCDTLCGIADRIVDNGMIIADEVGMGKTRIAATLARCVVAAGGRVAIIIPPGLGFQWQTELADAALTVPDVIRGLPSYYRAWQAADTRKASVQPLRPWYEQPALLISHAFGRWCLREGSERAALLPQLFARWRIDSGLRRPNNFDPAALPASWGAAAAKGIVAAVPDDPHHPGRIFLDALVAGRSWPELQDSRAYLQGGALRGQLENAVGLGLGIFDLVLIDEAHKGRHEDSRLSALLGKVTICASHVRKVGLTATPVELEPAQWWNTLARIGVGPVQLQCTVNGENDPIFAYAKAVQALRQTWSSSPAARENYGAAARAFEASLSPYLLRRDKRSDRAVIAYARYTGQPSDRYRNVDQEIVVDPVTLALAWKRAICAAEALSHIASRQSGAAGGAAQRLRLTIGNGHGIASLLDHVRRDEEEDRAQLDYDGTVVAPGAPEAAGTGGEKRMQRAAWWQQQVLIAFSDGGDAALYHHPAIGAAIKRIERANQANEKVLVFGRFTRPMKALTSLLNAREMLRRLEQGLPWPQAKVHGSPTGSAEHSEWPAVRIAWSQLCGTEMTPEQEGQVDDRLATQYNRLDAKRQKFRDDLLDRLEEDFGSPAFKRAAGPGSPGIAMLGAFRRLAMRPQESGALAIMARAMLELLPEQLLENRDPISPGLLAQTFLDLVRSAASQDLPDSDEEDWDESGDGNLLWESVIEKLHAEYGRPLGGFARLMNGNTGPDARRFLQLAFNRAGSFPNVLVAQSVVGREGLNLHGACRTVVLLHPEWNPGVVEQQIGRVDRVGSHWSRQLDAAIASGANPAQAPRIDVHPVVFGATYDAENWRVLRERWDDLRAQLHGVPVPARLAGNDAASAELIAQICAMAPDFSPPRH